MIKSRKVRWVRQIACMGGIENKDLLRIMKEGDHFEDLGVGGG
jgi:hypothetical protein